MTVCTLPEVELPIVPKQRVDTTAVDLSNDYGTSNLAFFYHVRSVAGNAASPWDAVVSWNAWELAVAEENVHSQINNGKLPSDDSILSRTKRSGYRGKVIAYMRELGESSWLVKTSSPDPKAFNGDVKNDTVNAKIRETLRGFYTTTEGLKNAMIVNNIANDIASTPKEAPRQVLSDVQFPNKGNAQDVNPDIRQRNFVVAQTQLGKKDSVHLHVEWADSWFKLDTAAWIEDSGRDSETKERIKAGLKIIQEMRLDVHEPVSK